MTKQEFKKWNDEMISRIIKQNEKIKSELNTKVLDRYNMVVVSTDFFYEVTSDDKGFAGVRVIAVMDDAARMTRQAAERIAREFHAENGYGKIEWQVMTEREYLTKLLEANSSTLEMISKYKD